MRSVTNLLFATLFGLVLMVLFLWYASSDPHSERAELATPSRSIGIAGDRPDAQGREMSLTLPNAASNPAHAVPTIEPTESSPSDTNQGAESSAPDVSEEPSFAIVRSTLADAIESHFPALGLSENELDDLASATLRIRIARERLRSIPKTREQASRRDETRQSLEEAIVDFTHIAEMDPAEFTRRVQPGVGIDELAPGEVPLDVSIRQLPRADELE